MAVEYELRLIEGRSATGEILLADLAAIAGPLQELSTRVARALVRHEGPGRSRLAVEEAATLRLRGVEPGSTRLRLTRGPDVLDIATDLDRGIDDELWRVLEGIAADRRPERISDLVAASAGDLVQALRASCALVEVRNERRDRALRIRTEHSHRETWTADVPVTADEIVAVTGRLEAVDLRSHRFRLRDDIGRTYRLHDVRDAATAARHVGEYVVARGRALRAAEDTLMGLEAPDLSVPADLGVKAGIPSDVSLTTILASAPGPDPEGGLDLTDKEFDSFLRAVRS